MHIHPYRISLHSMSICPIRENHQAFPDSTRDGTAKSNLSPKGWMDLQNSKPQLLPAWLIYHNYQ